MNQLSAEGKFLLPVSEEAKFALEKVVTLCDGIAPPMPLIKEITCRWSGGTVDL